MVLFVFHRDSRRPFFSLRLLFVKAVDTATATRSYTDTSNPIVDAYTFFGTFGRKRHNPDLHSSGENQFMSIDVEQDGHGNADPVFSETQRLKETTDNLQKAASQPAVEENYHDELMNATCSILDLFLHPFGHLLENELRMISELMSAWLERGTHEAAFMIDTLLNRVIDELRAGNAMATVDYELYGMVGIQNVWVSPLMWVLGCIALTFVLNRPSKPW